MVKKKKMIIAATALFLIVVISVLFAYKDDIMYGNTQDLYMSNCQISAVKTFPKSQSELYDSCSCSYENLLSFLGKDKMRSFTNVVIKQNKSLTNDFLAKENINIRKLDSNFISCF